MTANNWRNLVRTDRPHKKPDSESWNRGKRGKKLPKQKPSAETVAERKRQTEQAEERNRQYLRKRDQAAGANDNMTHGFRRAREFDLPGGTLVRASGLVEIVCNCGNFHPNQELTNQVGISKLVVGSHRCCGCCEKWEGK